MLRITTQDRAGVLVLRIEGRLEGPSVTVLERCWDGVRDGSGEMRHCLDLSGVTFIDARGKSLLALMHAQRAEFIAGNLMTEAIVAEIVGRGRPQRG